MDARHHSKPPSKIARRSAGGISVSQPPDVVGRLIGRHAALDLRHHVEGRAEDRACPRVSSQSTRGTGTSVFASSCMVRNWSPMSYSGKTW